MPRAPVWKEKQEKYLKRCSDEMLRGATLETYTAALNYCFKTAKELGWPLNPEKILPEHIREICEYMLDEDASTSKQSLYIGRLLDFLKFCENPHIQRVRVRIDVCRTNVNWLTVDEIAKVIRSAHYPQLLAALVLASYCGLRREEIVGLRWSNITEKQLTVIGKGAKQRTIPLDRAFWEAMKPYLEWADKNPRTEFFLSYIQNGRPHQYSGVGVGEMIRAFAKRLRMKFSTHTFRRSFGRHLYKAGCPPGELRVLMGHKNWSTTEKYLGIGDFDIEEAMTFRPDYLGGKK